MLNHVYHRYVCLMNSTCIANTVSRPSSLNVSFNFVPVDCKSSEFVRGLAKPLRVRSRCDRYLLADLSMVRSSASFLAEVSVRSPRKLFIFIIYRNIFRIKLSKKTFHLILKKEALVRSVVLAVMYTFTKAALCRISS